MVKYRYKKNGIMTFYTDRGTSKEKAYIVSEKNPIVELEKEVEIDGLELVETNEKNTIKKKKSKGVD